MRRLLMKPSLRTDRTASSSLSMRRLIGGRQRPIESYRTASPFVVQAGTIIPAALITGIRSDLPGQITAQVTENVYDTLMSQIKVTASSSATRGVTLDLLGSDAAYRKDSYYVKTSRNDQNEASRGFQIDAGGACNLRVTVEGPEAGRFCVLLGGSALPNVKAAECPADPATVVAQAPRVEAAPAPAPAPRVEVAPPPPVEAPPPPPKTVEVVTTKCEQRLRVGSELLFDFDKSAIRPEARPAIEYVAQTVQRAGKPVLIEGHTNSKGGDAYNMRLSELRAFTVQSEITRQLDIALPMQSRGYGKSRPIADNQYPDGSDNPDGRQRNRRVEIVVNTCM